MNQSLIRLQNLSNEISGGEGLYSLTGDYNSFKLIDIALAECSLPPKLFIVAVGAPLNCSKNRDGNQWCVVPSWVCLSTHARPSFNNRSKTRCVRCGSQRKWSHINSLLTQPPVSSANCSTRASSMLSSPGTLWTRKRSPPRAISSNPWPSTFSFFTARITSSL